MARRDGERPATRRGVVPPRSRRTAATTSTDPVGLDDVGLRDDRDTVADPQRVEQREVLERLGARPVVGGHDEQRGIDLAGADEHVADEPVVAGDVDEVELGAVIGSARCA